MFGNLRRCSENELLEFVRLICSRDDPSGGLSEFSKTEMAQIDAEFRRRNLLLGVKEEDEAPRKKAPAMAPVAETFPARKAKAK